MKKILATGAMLAYITWFNSTGASAAAMPEILATDIQGPKHHQGVRHDKTRAEKVTRLAEKLGVDIEELYKDIKSDKTLKEILKDHHITKKQFRELTNKRAR